MRLFCILDLFIMVISAPSHFLQRLAIRQTWGSFAHRRDISMAFIIGALEKQSIEPSLKDESDMYGDIVRARFIENYSNLTLKTLSMFEWVERFCSRTKFILKADDDMYINFPRLLPFIEQHRSEEEQKIIYGRIAHG